jgi:hypothetical protein
MLAVLYVLVVVVAADAISRRWFAYVSSLHRVATAIVVGLPLGAFLSYLGGLAFRGSDDPVLLGDAVAVALLAGLIVVLRRRGRASRLPPTGPTNRSDRITTAAMLAVVGWMMLTTYTWSTNAQGGEQLGIASGLWSDFGPTTAISQSFAVGRNFPTVYPHFAFEPIRYHFMFYFQVGNLTHLGLDPALANNAMSIATLVSMLVLVMALGVRLFGSALVGRLGALLFFVHGTLSFIPFLGSYPSLGDALAALPDLRTFVSSGFPYRGEEWGIWTQMVFLNQRHLASAIAMLLVIVLFLLERLGPDPGLMADAIHPDRSISRTSRIRRHLVARGTGATKRLGRTFRHPRRLVRETIADPTLPGYVLCGLIAGMLPIWNGAIFIATIAVLGVWFVVFPRRPQMLVLAATAGVVSLPQVLFIRPDAAATSQSFPTFHWGYIIEDPNLAHVGTYLAFIFGLKLLLTAVQLSRSTSRQVRILLAFSLLVIVAFTVQLSVEVLANHKFLNTWLVVVNLFAAAGAVRLWRARPARLPGVRIPARLAAVGLVGLVVAGGLIDFMPVKNQGLVEIPLDGDALYDWVRADTKPHDVFLTDVVSVHPILLAGRAVYFGWPYYSWSAGYDTFAREKEYRSLLSMRSARELVKRLQADRIAYVAVDDGLRQNVPGLNEDVLRSSLKLAFRGADGAYGNLSVFRVPSDPRAADSLPAGVPPTMEVAGVGSGPGQFTEPRGIATGPDGDILVADSGNHRIQRFAEDGAFRATYGSEGDGPGQLRAPSGVGADSRGHIFIADPGKHRLVELDAGGVFVSEWAGPDPGFYGPRDVAVGADDAVYVLDQGRARVVRRAADGTVRTFGSFGSADGQLNDPTGVAVVGDLVAVADPTNSRIVVFDASGQFVRAISVAEWTAAVRTADVLGSAEGTSLFASSAATRQVFVYDVATGARTGTLVPPPPGEFHEPAALARSADGDLVVVDNAASRVVRLPAP